MKAAVLEVYHKPLQIREKGYAAAGPGGYDRSQRLRPLLYGCPYFRREDPHGQAAPYSGDEFAGVVSRSGAGVKDFSVGDRVVVCVDASCGRCDFCLRGETNRCSNLVRIGFERSGGMGEFVNVPAANLEKISPQLPFEKAAIVPDAVVCMYRGLKSLGGVTAGTKVAIVGVGGLGMQGIRIGRLLGGACHRTSRNDQKLELARSIGADLTINTKRESLPEIAKKMGGFDVVADLIGTPGIDIGSGNAVPKRRQSHCPGLCGPTHGNPFLRNRDSGKTGDWVPGRNAERIPGGGELGQ